MIRLVALYPNHPGARFDLKYYVDTHVPLVKNRLAKHGLVRAEVDSGISALGGGSAPFVCIGHFYFDSKEALENGLAAHGQEIMADIPHYTTIRPQLQVSEIVAS